MTLVDDFGRYDGRAALLHGECFALRNDVKPQQTAALLRELHDRDLIMLYVSGGKEYLQVQQWQERTRSEHSRYPDPQDSAAERRIPQQKDASLAIAITSKPSPSPADGECVKIYESYPLKVGKPDALRAIRKAVQKHGFDTILTKTRAFSVARGGDTSFVPNPSTWFNQERYNDDPETWKPKVNPSVNGKAKYVDPNQERKDREYEEHRARHLAEKARKNEQQRTANP